MTNYVDQPGNGTLFVNTNKAADNHPDRSGYILIDKNRKAGERVRIAGWIAKYKDGGGIVKDREGNPILNLKMSDEKTMNNPAQEDVPPGGLEDKLTF